LHRRVGEILRDNFASTAAAEPELLAHHFTQAGLTETAIEWWGKAGHRSLERSALAEAAAQLTRALDQIATLPATPALRREQIRLQVALHTPLYHVKGPAAPETRAAAEQARLLIERAEALNEPIEDPLFLLSALYGSWLATLNAFNRDALLKLATQFLVLAEKQGTTVPLMTGHRLMGNSLLLAGSIAEGRAHLDRAFALYDPAQHRPLAMRFGQEIGVATQCFRSLALWSLGYPEAALRDADQALNAAREMGQAATLMFALFFASFTPIFCGHCGAAGAQLGELTALADEKGSLIWRPFGTLLHGCAFASSGEPAQAVHMINTGITAYQSTGTTLFIPFHLSNLAIAHAALGQSDEAWRRVDEAMSTVETTKERWYEAEINRIAGEISLKSPEPDAAKAEAYFERSLVVARQQQAKSWELRAAMSLARLWRDQGKAQQARELLAPVYGWFTEGFDTRDLKEAKALLDELTS
jgi:predicted ATPase